MSANADIITVETYVQEKISFSYMGQNVNFFAILRGPSWVFNYQAGLMLLYSNPLTHIYVHVKFMFKSKIFVFTFWGSREALTSNPGLPKFQGNKINSQRRHMYKMQKNIFGYMQIK